MSKTPAIYGSPPVNLSRIDIEHDEMLYWLYCAIKKPDSQMVVPPNLIQFTPIVKRALSDAGYVLGTNTANDYYVYITAKRMWVNNKTANRPGWHSDGFLTDDLNYIWTDVTPTIFCVDGPVSFTADHNTSLKEMEEWAEVRPEKYIRYPARHLLRLNQSCIHKVDDNMIPCVRTFVKVSISKHVYALEGNSINHELPLGVEYAERKKERNCPAGKCSI